MIILDNDGQDIMKLASMVGTFKPSEQPVSPVSISTFHMHLENVRSLTSGLSTRKSIIRAAGAEINNLIRDIYSLERDKIARHGAGNYYRLLFKRVLRLLNKNVTEDFKNLMDQVKLL